MYEISSQIIERYHSKRFSFIDLPLDCVVDELNRNDPSSSIKSSASPVAGSWPQLLLNRATPPTTSVLVRSNSRWSMIVNNDLLHNPSPVFLSLAYKLKRACISFRLDDLASCRNSGQPYGVCFDYEDHRQDESISRSVYVAFDGGRWTFCSHGEPLFFEDVDHYRLKRKQDRLTPQMLLEFARRLEIEFDIPIDQGLLVEWESRRRVSLQEHLDEMQRFLTKSGIPGKLTPLDIEDQDGSLSP